jgi:hypothetical protein
MAFLGNSCHKSSDYSPPSKKIIHKYIESKSFCGFNASQSNWPLRLSAQEGLPSMDEPSFLSEIDKNSCGFGIIAQQGHQKRASHYCATFSSDPCCDTLPRQRNWQSSKKVPMGVSYSSDDSRYDSLFFGLFCLFMFSLSWMIGYSLLNTICVKVQRHRFTDNGESPLSESSLLPPYSSPRGLVHHPSNMSMQSESTLVECPVYLHDFAGDSAPPARLSANG